MDTDDPTMSLGCSNDVSRMISDALKRSMFTHGSHSPGRQNEQDVFFTVTKEFYFFKFSPCYEFEVSSK